MGFGFKPIERQQLFLQTSKITAGKITYMAIQFLKICRRKIDMLSAVVESLDSKRSFVNPEKFFKITRRMLAMPRFSISWGNCPLTHLHPFSFEKIIFFCF